MLGSLLLATSAVPLLDDLGKVTAAHNSQRKRHPHKPSWRAIALQLELDFRLEVGNLFCLEHDIAVELFAILQHRQPH